MFFQQLHCHPQGDGLRMLAKSRFADRAGDAAQSRRAMPQRAILGDGATKPYRRSAGFSHNRFAPLIRGAIRL